MKDISKLAGVAAAVALIAAAAGCGSADDTMSTEDRGSDVVRDRDTQQRSGDAESGQSADGDNGDPAGEEVLAANIEVVETGFYNFPAESEYGEPDGVGVAILHNPSPNIARGVEAQVTLLDAEGAILRSETTHVTAILPDASVSVTTLALGVDNVAEVSVQARASSWETPENDLGALTVSNMNIRLVEYGGADINGAVASTVGQDLEDVVVTIVFRDSGGTLVAGEHGYVDFVPANGESPFTISTLMPIPPDWTAEGFAFPSGLTLTN